ncbi:MAG: PTS sugar transporter subunit IIA [Desulfovibrionaceae bacterium]|nr:PTS sugar transporter subunit IIA [Desulfovibrionaceae bacterium]
MADKKGGEGAGRVAVILVTHGGLGKSLIEAAEMILGPQEGCRSVSLAPSNGVEDTVESIRSAIAESDMGGGCLLLTDLFGGTPTTLSLSLIRSFNMEVVSGVNLPMTLAAMQNRGLPLSELAAKAKEMALRGVVVAGELVRRRQGEPEAGHKKG